MRNVLIILFIISFCSNILAQSLFESNFHEVNFVSDDIQNKKINKINQIKKQSLLEIFNLILLKSDFNYIQKNLDLDFTNSLIKNIVIENEKIVNNNYSSEIKINFNKNKIINFLRQNKFSYVEYLPKQYLTIIYENNNLNKNLFSKNNLHYNFLINNYYDNKIYFIPNLDINDRYLLSPNDIDNNNIKKIIKLKKKYLNLETILIISHNNGKKIKYTTYLLTDNKLQEIKQYEYSEYNFDDFFKNFKSEIINEWKIHNQIQNNKINNIFCNINYYNLLELKKIKSNLENISIIKFIEVKKIALKLNNYKIDFYGNKSILKNLFDLNNMNISFQNQKCKINLK